MVNLDKITRNGKCLLLAYDQGFEHGPTDFNQVNADPQYVFDIAKNSGVVTCLAVQRGLADKYSDGSIPLIIKLNGKTNYHKGEEMFSPQNCGVDEAVLKYKAAGVGYTVYVGSERENESFAEFGQIVSRAHAFDVPVIMWAYPRGKHIGEAEHSVENVAYAARIALELGADMVKVSYTGDVESMKWVVKVAGKTKVLVVGGSKTDEQTFLERTNDILKAGATGWAVGRNVWQDGQPIEFVKKVGEVLFK